MSSEFGLEPGELAAAAERFDAAARAAADAFAGLRDGLAALGDPLGSDEQGRAFAARYDPAAADGLAAIGREAESLRSLGDALRQAAAAHQAVDDQAAGRWPSTG